MSARSAHAAAMALVLLAAPLTPAGRAAQPPSTAAGETADDALAAAERLFVTGRFAEAAALGERVATGESLTLAVRSRLALAYTRPPTRPRVCEETAALAERASALRPGNAESLRLWAIALGNVARNQSSMAALAANYPERTRQLIDRARALEPQSPWVHAISGAWHAEIVGHLGATIADSLFAASADAARADFARAIELDPANPIVRAELAHALLLLGDKAAARVELERTARLPARDVMEALIQSHARESMRALDDGDLDPAKRLLEPTC